MKIHENPFGSQLATREHTDNTDMMRLTGVFFSISLRSQKAEHQ
jgi:hypothetical protein